MTAYINHFISVFAAIVLFLFSLKAFSKEIQDIGSDYIKKWLSRITTNRFKGFLVGVFATALIQSSSAVSAIVVALIDASVIPFYNSLGVLLGINVGTTFTAWLVAFKIENLGSILIVLGTLISLVPNKINLFGKSIFYLGLILFTLQLINQALKPFNNDPIFIDILSYADHLAIGLLAGAILTAILQSSSVVVGLIIILASQGLVGLEGAIAVLLGSNLGTTSTAIIAAIKMSENAKKAAKANLYFNFIGVIVFLPFVKPFTYLINRLDFDLTYQIATAHLIFNFIVAFIFLLLLNKVHQWLIKPQQ